MGQRLVIQNQINGESVNVSYYHWSAYTESSIEELKDFANRLLENYENRSDSFLTMLTDAGKELIEKLDNGSLTDNENVDAFVANVSALTNVSKEESNDTALLRIECYKRQLDDYQSRFHNQLPPTNVGGLSLI